MTSKSLFLFAGMFLAAASQVFSASANASTYTLTVAQVGSNVVATGSGSFDLDGLAVGASSNFSPYMAPTYFNILTGALNSDFQQYAGGTVNFSFGPGGTAFADSGSGDYVGLAGDDSDGQVFYLPSGYVSGASLSSTATWNNTTFSGLGLTDGTYTSTWDHCQNSFVLQIGPLATSPVPEPSSLIFLTTGILAAAGALRRRVLNR
jgi:PEP-CTERM motif